MSVSGCLAVLLWLLKDQSLHLLQSWHSLLRAWYDVQTLLKFLSESRSYHRSVESQRLDEVHR